VKSAVSQIKRHLRIFFHAQKKEGIDQKNETYPKKQSQMKTNSKQQYYIT